MRREENGKKEGRKGRECVCSAWNLVA